MKNSKKLIICLSVVLALSFALSCKKDNGDGGSSNNDGGSKGTDTVTISAFISRAGTNPQKTTELSKD